MSGKHKCPVDGCTVMCRPHWFTVPHDIRRAVLATWNGGDCDWLNPESEYIKAREAAIDAVNAKVKARADRL